MKIRNDFVTNSSSSSFIVAKKDELSNLQKETILDYVEKTIFGRKIASNKAELNDFFKRTYCEDYYDFEIGMENTDPYKSYYKLKYYLKSLEAINNGLTVYSGWVSFEEGDEFAYFLSNIWNEIEKADKNSFVSINTDLDY